jgi:hypothetical protein
MRRHDSLALLGWIFDEQDPAPTEDTTIPSEGEPARSIVDLLAVDHIFKLPHSALEAGKENSDAWRGE